jgi:alpha-D-ribose 1-methylphosphonate 5-triphosphate diphosphatase
MPLDHFTLTGATCLTPDGLRTAPLRVAGGRIGVRGGSGGAKVAASGYLILPGIVDLHGDGFEHHLAPRRGAVQDLGLGLRALDAELAANGITTAVLAQFFSWEGGMRGPDFAERVAGAVAASDALTDLRLQLRLEVNLLDAYPRALALMEAHDLGYVVFNDHLPHEALAKGKRPPRLTGQALKSGRSPEAHLALMQGLHARRAEVWPALEVLAARLKARGVRMGSHDDDTPERRARFRALGATIAEFPETRATALAAKAAGDAVLMGAPNVVRGGSHDRNQSAADLLRDDALDALVSDYHYPAPLTAVFRLVDAEHPLAEVWPLVSARPAQIVGLRDRGQIAEGLRADLCILNASTRRVEGTLVGGRFSFLSGGLATRVLEATRCA